MKLKKMKDERSAPVILRKVTLPVPASAIGRAERHASNIRLLEQKGVHQQVITALERISSLVQSQPEFYGILCVPLRTYERISKVISLIAGSNGSVMCGEKKVGPSTVTFVECTNMDPTTFLCRELKELFKCRMTCTKIPSSGVTFTEATLTVEISK